MLATLGKLLTLGCHLRPVLVVGTARTGTTAFRAALGQHPHFLAAPGDAPLLSFVGSLVRAFEHDEELREYHLHTLEISRTRLHARLRDLGFEAAIGRSHGLFWLARCLPARPFAPFRLRRWVATTYLTEEGYRGLSSLYPSLGLVYLVRNGCEVVESRRRFPPLARSSFIRQCEAWRDSVSAFRYLREVATCLTIRHEDLVSDPSLVFSEVLDFLDEPRHAGPARYAASTLRHPLDQPTQRGVKVRELLSDRPAPYQHWSPRERRQFEEICAEAMEEVGYEMPF